MLKKYSKDQLLTLASAVIFLVGAVFMLVNVFGGHDWSFIVGLVMAVLASGLAVLAYYINKKQVRENLEASTPQVTEQ